MEIMANLQAAYWETVHFALNLMISWSGSEYFVSISSFWAHFWSEGQFSEFEHGNVTGGFDSQSGQSEFSVPVWVFFSFLPQSKNLDG